MTITDLAARPLREVTQTILYSPEQELAGIFGNCLQAALASALDMDLEAVPNFAAFTWWEPAARLWLRGIGADWRMVVVPVPVPGSVAIPQARSIVVGRLIRAAVREERRKPRYHVMRELDPGWHQVRAVLRSRPDTEVDALIRRSQNGEGRQ